MGGAENDHAEALPQAPVQHLLPVSAGMDAVVRVRVQK